MYFYGLSVLSLTKKTKILEPILYLLEIFTLSEYESQSDNHHNYIQ